MDDQDELMAMANMLKHSKAHGLEVECVWSLVHEIAGMARTATSEEKIYFQQRSFTKKAQAESFALDQLISMEGFYLSKLNAILSLKVKLENKGG